MFDVHVPVDVVHANVVLLTTRSVAEAINKYNRSYTRRLQQVL